MEEVDVAIVGAGAAGLAVAVGLHRVNPRLRIKVLESRPAPSSKYAGFVKLQPNGLNAAAAISPALASSLNKLGLKEKRTLLHGEDGRLITRLDTREELVAAPSGPLEHERFLSSGSKAFYTYEADEEGVEEEETGGSSSRWRPSPTKRKPRSGAGSQSITYVDPVMERRRQQNVDESSSNIIVGWYELERLLLSMLPPHTVEYEASFLKYHESEGGVVSIYEGLAYPMRSRVLLGCDGPFSGVRAQCVQDSEPAYDRTVKWVGRLDGHHVSTTPLDYSAWWLKKGQVFVSHPLANGDVGWEALVSDRDLQAAGFTFDESAGRVLPVGTQKELKEKGKLGELAPSQVLADVFRSWPKSVDQMIRFAPPEAVLESGVYIRSASDMPPSMGKGRVAILGEAAHPLRPTGQDTNMAFEDAAELAAFVQEYGVTKEALRRYDVARRPRWRHVAQLSYAQGASTTTGIALTRGFIDYTEDLYRHPFRPLGRRAQRAALKQAGGGVVARLMQLAVRLLLTGVALSGVLLSSGLVLPPADDEPARLSAAGRSAQVEEGGRAGQVVHRAARTAHRGALRLAGVAKAVWRVVSRSKPAVVAKAEVQQASRFVGHKADDVTGVVLDTAAGVAKKSIQQRLAQAVGAF